MGDSKLPSFEEATASLRAFLGKQSLNSDVLWICREIFLEQWPKLYVKLPLHNESSLAEAQRVMDSVLSRGTLDVGEETYLDSLSDLVGAYEDEHHAIEPASDADMLRHLMEAKGVSQMQLSRDTGLPKSTISEVLAGKKPFSRKMIHALAEYFQVAVGVLAANI